MLSLSWQYMIYLVGKDTYYLVYEVSSIVPVARDKNIKNKTIDFNKNYSNSLVGGENLKKKNYSVKYNNNI